MNKDALYIGDAVYVSRVDDVYKLETRGGITDQKIYLEVETLKNLIDYVKLHTPELFK